MNENYSDSVSSQAKSNGKWAAKEGTAIAKDATAAVREGVKDAANLVKEGSKETSSVVGELSAKAENLTTRVRDFAGHAPEAVADLSKQATGYVRQYPIETAVGALVVGFLAGVALCRRK